MADVPVESIRTSPLNTCLQNIDCAPKHRTYSPYPPGRKLHLQSNRKRSKIRYIIYCEAEENSHMAIKIIMQLTREWTRSDDPIASSSSCLLLDLMQLQPW